MSDKTQKLGYDNVPYDNMKTDLPHSISLLTPHFLLPYLLNQLCNLTKLDSMAVSIVLSPRKVHTAL